MSREFLPSDRFGDVKHRLKSVMKLAKMNSGFDFSKEPAEAVELASNPYARKWALLEAHKARLPEEGDDLTVAMYIRLKKYVKTSPASLPFGESGDKIGGILLDELEAVDFVLFREEGLYRADMELTWHYIGGDRALPLRKPQQSMLQVRITAKFCRKHDSEKLERIFYETNDSGDVETVVFGEPYSEENLGNVEMDWGDVGTDSKVVDLPIRL
ncbi:hypothetical protein SLS60_009802 [Paraconiothyrium brasiliense]|uniref:Uncharacterized protein n=1 Tax=Paraconiothyrium brasiliense TaxID=300254 RepID=A0ABR3QSI7_9PLEO